MSPQLGETGALPDHPPHDPLLESCSGPRDVREVTSGDGSLEPTVVADFR